MKTLLKYDFFQLSRTKKLLVFPILFILFNSISAITTRYLNQILASTLTDSGAQITLPDPTVYDSYVQYNQDLYQIVLYIIIFIAVGFFIGDKTKSIIPLIFSKPIKPGYYILSKYITMNLLIIGSLICGQIFFGYYTYILFGQFLFKASLVSILTFIGYSLFITSVAMFFSVFGKNYVTGLVGTFLVYLVITLLNIFHGIEIISWLPGSMATNAIDYIGNHSNTWLISVMAALGFSAVFMLFSINKIRNQDRYN